MSFFSFLSSSVFPQTEREREDIWLGIGRNSLKIYLSYFDGFLWRIFPLLQANRLDVLFSPGLKVWLLLVQDTFHLPLPGVLALDSSATTFVQQLIFFFPTSADGRSSHFCLRVLANHFWLLSSSFPWSGDSLGLLYVTRVRLPSTDSLTHIFSDRPYYYPVLTVILWWLANSNTRYSRNSLFLLSQGDTTWHKLQWW